MNNPTPLVENVQRRIVEDSFICLYFFLFFLTIMVILSTFFLKKDIDLNSFNEKKLLLNPQRSTTSGTNKSFTLEKELSQKCVARNFLLQKYWNKRFPESARNSRISHFHHKNRTNEINHSIHPSKASHDQFSSSPSFFSPPRIARGWASF